MLCREYRSLYVHAYVGQRAAVGVDREARVTDPRGSACLCLLILEGQAGVTAPDFLVIHFFNVESGGCVQVLKSIRRAFLCLNLLLLLLSSTPLLFFYFFYFFF